MVLATLVSVREQVEVFYRITQRINRNAYGEATSVLIAWTSGGEEEDRTPDLVIANDALYQLSYFPSCKVAIIILW